MGFRQIDPLTRLARLCGVQPAYFATTGSWRHAKPGELLAAARALGCSLESAGEAPRALAGLRLAHWRQGVAPVTVAWQGAPLRLLVKIPAALAGQRLEYSLQLEGGQHVRSGFFSPEQVEPRRRVTVEGEDFAVLSLELDGGLPWGYHTLALTLPKWRRETQVISAPEKAWEPEGGIPEHAWGGFLPLYSLGRADDWGLGDFGGMLELQKWLEGLGASVTATLPLLACFLRPEDGQFEPSPYSPASRLFWNEIFIDAARVPELAACAEARELIASEAFQQELKALREEPLVDYARAMAAKRKVLELLARSLKGERKAAFNRYVKENPALKDYAAFRAAFEKQGQTWRLWPEAMRAGKLKRGDYDESVAVYHQYVQWIADEQISELARHASANGLGLYLDMPLGVHSDSYDVWREQACFAHEASAGAPPDGFFAAGQDWGFPPLHPERDRAQGHRYFVSFVRQLMGKAGVLRIDHVAWLHRLYWIPRGMSAKEGVYVRYHADELYAILCLESHRLQCSLVGEDLGTVPPYVGHAMEWHQARRMFVQLFSMSDDVKEPLGEVTPGTVASLNTHDLPTFGGFWHGRDTAIMHELGFFSDGQRDAEIDWRDKLRAALRARFGLEHADEGKAAWELMLQATWHLARSKAALTIITLEDLWLEKEPQNVPGTWRERPNWRRRALLSMERFTQHGEVLWILGEVNRLRREAK